MITDLSMKYFLDRSKEDITNEDREALIDFFDNDCSNIRFDYDKCKKTLDRYTIWVESQTLTFREIQMMNLLRSLTKIK